MNITIEKVQNEWQQYTLSNQHGMRVSVLDFGGIITEISVPDRENKLENIVLTYKDYGEYKNNPNYFGAIIGRVAGRIKNASFALNEQEYIVEKNNGAHHLHGGSDGFHQVIWNCAPFQTDETVGVVLTHRSIADSSNYPGNVDVTVTYTLTANNELIIDYVATSDKTTALTLTNHSYFNLTGQLSNTIHHHHVTMNADEFIELDQDLIATGRKVDVTNTVFDFRLGRQLNDGIQSTAEQNRIASGGYDHYFMFNKKQDNEIIVKEPASGRVMTVTTNQPGVVMYTANTLSSELDLVEGQSKPYLGVCFETQGSPASLHHADFPSIILQENERYEKQTTFAFRTE